MASKYIQKFPIPGQFPDILHDFVREVLRDQPENIFEYGAAYFTALDEVSPVDLAALCTAYYNFSIIAMNLKRISKCSAFSTLSLNRFVTDGARERAHEFVSVGSRFPI